LHLFVIKACGNTNAHQNLNELIMPIALWALTISACAIGTTEFVIVVLSPTIAEQLRITLPAAVSVILHC